VIDKISQGLGELFGGPVFKSPDNLFYQFSIVGSCRQDPVKA
jgi:hypothetical protein